MKRRRWRRVAILSAIAAIMLGLLAYRSHFSELSLRLHTFEKTELSFYAAKGEAAFAFRTDPGLSRPAIQWLSVPADTSYRLREEFEEPFLGFSVKGRNYSRRGGTIIIHAILLPLTGIAVAGLFTAGLLAAYAFGKPTGTTGGRVLCGGCGYDLTGNVTGRCPECGAAAEPAAGRKLPS